MNLGSPYDAFDDPYCYHGSFILKNRFDLRDASQLEALEVEMFAARGEELLPVGAFDPTRYCAVHHHLFQDVYEWAGHYRTIRIAKGNAMFCFPEHIAEQMDLLFISLRKPSFLTGATTADFITAAAQFLGELNAVHPFREGNGRTQLTFLFLLGHRARHVLDMARIRPVEMLAAMIASFKGKLKPLENEIAFLLV
jgi:cell filamentation protein